LFPDDLDGLIQDVLFCAANWSFLAKLHVQSMSTVRLLEARTKEFGALLRKLRRATQNVNIVETPSEVRARKQRASGSNPKGLGGNTTQPSESTSSGPKPRPLNLNTVKKHLLPHVIDSILRYGSTDSYSSRRVCLVVSASEFYHCLIFELGRIRTQDCQGIVHEDKWEGV
jgi:hypothetical protein